MAGVLLPGFFLDFVHRSNVKKVTYAASCNRSSFFNNPAKVIECGKLAKQFSGISVREDYLVSLCKDKLGIDVQWVLDPTMLLTPNDYVESAVNQVGEAPVIFTYILDVDKNKTAAINYLSSKLGLPIVCGNRVDESKNGGGYTHLWIIGFIILTDPSMLLLTLSMVRCFLFFLISLLSQLVTPNVEMPVSNPY